MRSTGATQSSVNRPQTVNNEDTNNSNDDNETDNNNNNDDVELTVHDRNEIANLDTENLYLFFKKKSLKPQYANIMVVAEALKSQDMNGQNFLQLQKEDISELGLKLGPRKTLFALLNTIK
jgi:hypothetical protein